MKIKIDRNSEEGREYPIITIDTKKCIYPYAIREALIIAMELDGYGKGDIEAVFNTGRDLAAKEPKQ
jgi:hypothetical protein